MHTDSRRSKRVIGWEEERSPILAVMVRRIWRACEDVVPFQNVGFRGLCGDVWGRVGLNGLVFPCELRCLLALCFFNGRGVLTRLLAVLVAIMACLGDEWM